MGRGWVEEVLEDIDAEEEDLAVEDDLGTSDLGLHDKINIQKENKMKE